MSKATIATVKSFIRKNAGNLKIRNLSDFDGMQDCVTSCSNKSWRDAEKAPEHMGENTLGIKGAWFVLRSRDSISPLSENGYTGFHIYNCCGSFDIAVADQSA